MPGPWKYETMYNIGYMIHELPRNARNVLLEAAIIPEAHMCNGKEQYQSGYVLVKARRKRIQENIERTQDPGLQSDRLQGQSALTKWFDNNMINAVREYHERKAEEHMSYQGYKSVQEQDHSTVRYMSSQHCGECHHWNKLKSTICSRCRREFPNCGPLFEVPTNYVYDFEGVPSHRTTPLEDRWFPEYKCCREVTNDKGIKQRCHTTNVGEQINYDQRINDYQELDRGQPILPARAFRPRHISIGEWRQLAHDEKIEISNEDFRRKIAMQRIEAGIFGDDENEQPILLGGQGADRPNQELPERKIRRICAPFVKPGLILGFAILFAFIYKNSATQVAIVERDMPLRVCAPVEIADSRFGDSTTLFICFVFMLYGIFSFGKDIYKYLMKPPAPNTANTPTQTPSCDVNVENKNTQSMCTYTSVAAWPYTLSQARFRWIEDHGGVWSGSRVT
jgi:hypothetical protein